MRGPVTPALPCRSNGRCVHACSSPWWRTGVSNVCGKRVPGCTAACTCWLVPATTITVPACAYASSRACALLASLVVPAGLLAAAAKAARDAGVGGNVPDPAAAMGMDGVDPAVMNRQAQQIWSMLDDMASNDPKVRVWLGAQWAWDAACVWRW